MPILDVTSIQTGTGTLFTKMLSKGSPIGINGSNVSTELYTVLSIADDTHLTLTQPFSGKTKPQPPDLDGALYTVIQPGSLSIPLSGIPSSLSTSNAKVTWSDGTTSIVPLSTLQLLFRRSY